MTCIVGVEHGGRVYLGGDACVAWADCQTRLPQRKVRRVSGIVMGASGAMREVGLVLTWTPPRYDGSDPHLWVVEVFAAEFLRRLKAGGVRKPQVELLIGVGGTLLSVDAWGGEHGWPEGYGASGSGAEVAKGALGALPRASPRTRLRRALELAAEHCYAVSPPFAYVSAA